MDFLSPKPIIHEVNGHELSFYPTRVGTAFAVKDILTPLTSAIAEVMSNTNSDRGYQTVVNKDKDGTEYEQNTVEPISLELAEKRSRDKQKAILDLLETVTTEKPLNAICRIVMDSLRDDFPKHFEISDVKAFRDEADTSSMVQLVTGVVKANSQAFGPLGLKVGKLIKMATTKIEHHLTLMTEDSETVETDETIGTPSVQ